MECTNLTVLQKKSGAPAESGALLFNGRFLGVFWKKWVFLDGFLW
jgi:hypothetical protein